MSQASSSPPAEASDARVPCGREHRGDQGVGPAEELVQTRVRAPQRTAVHGKGVGAARLDGVAQHVDERGVAGEVVRPVEEHADGRAALGERTAAVQAPLGHLLRLGEAVPGQQDGVGEEAGQLDEVARAALHQVAQRLGDDARRYGRLGHQLGVRHGLTAEQHGGDARRLQRREAVLPGALAAQQADHGDGAALDQCGQFVLDVDTGRVADPVRRARGARGEEVGVGGRQQQHGAHRGGQWRVHARAPGAPGAMKGSPAGAPDSMSRHSASVSACSSIRSPRRSSCSSRSPAKQVSGAGTNRRPHGLRDLGQEAAPEGVALQRAVPVGAPHGAGPAAVETLPAAVGEEGFAAAHVRDAVVDLVPLDRGAEGLPGRAGEGLLAVEPDAYGQQSEPVDLPGARLHVVLDVLAEDLVAAADAEDRASFGGAPQQCVGEPALAQPGECLHRAAGAGHDDEVGVVEFLGPVHEPYDDARFGGQRVHVGEVGHQRHGAHGDAQDVLAVRRSDDGLAYGAAQRDPQSVLLVDAETVGERQHPVRRPSRQTVQHVQTGLQQRDVAAELVDQVAA